MSGSIAQYKISEIPVGMKIQKVVDEKVQYLLTPEALQFIAQLHRKFNPIRKKLLANRRLVQVNTQRGAFVNYDRTTKHIRTGEWLITGMPEHLADRRIEYVSTIQNIQNLATQPTLSVVDLEDQTTPSWEYILESHALLEQSKAQLIVCPRAWHRNESNIIIDNEPLAAVFFDVGLYLYHARNNQDLLHLQLPKMEHYLEARLWTKVFELAQRELSIDTTQIKVTLAIETLPAVFQIDELLWELRNYATGIQTNLKNYLASFIQCLRYTTLVSFPVFEKLTSDVHFVKSYYNSVVKKAHQRNIHAIADTSVLTATEAFAQGFDGISITDKAALEIVLKHQNEWLNQTNQIENKRKDSYIIAEDILKTSTVELTEQDLCSTAQKAICAIEHSLNSEEHDASFSEAELYRSLIWQWVHLGTSIQNGSPLTLRNINQYVEIALENIRASIGSTAFMERPFMESVRIFNQQLKDITFTPSLTPILDRKLKQHVKTFV